MLPVSLYSKYEIMPNLQVHQLRVASVAKLICDSLTSVNINSVSVVKVCLFHDMGNIIKFDLDHTQDFIRLENVRYWREVKSRFIKLYGTNEHLATEKICREIGFTPTELNCLTAITFAGVRRVLQYGSLEEKICCYSDQRVGPHGVLTLTERLLEGKKRYSDVKDKQIDDQKFEMIVGCFRELEMQIFSYSKISPDSIDNFSVEKEISKIRMTELNSTSVFIGLE